MQIVAELIVFYAHDVFSTEGEAVKETQETPFSNLLHKNINLLKSVWKKGQLFFHLL